MSGLSAFTAGGLIGGPGKRSGGGGGKGRSSTGSGIRLMGGGWRWRAGAAAFMGSAPGGGDVIGLGAERGGAFLTLPLLIVPFRERAS